MIIKFMKKAWCFRTMVYAILKVKKFPYIGKGLAIEAVNTEKKLKIILPLSNLKNYISTHKEAIKLVQ